MALGHWAPKRSTAFSPRCAEQLSMIQNTRPDFLAHDFSHEACHGRNAVLRFPTSEDLGAVDIPSGQVDPGTLTKIFVFSPGGRSGMQSAVSGEEPEMLVFSSAKMT